MPHRAKPESAEQAARIFRFLFARQQQAQALFVRPCVGGRFVSGRSFGTILADPPWQFQNRTGKVAPEHRRLTRYGTLTLPEITALPVAEAAAEVCHLYLWVPNALLPEGLQVMAAWGFQYKSNLVWHKIRKDGGPDGRGVGFYFRNVTELILFGVRGKNARTLAPGRSQVNFLATQKREHSRKPDEFYEIVESCSPGPRLEMFARGARPAVPSKPPPRPRGPAAASCCARR